MYELVEQDRALMNSQPQLLWLSVAPLYLHGLYDVLLGCAPVQKLNNSL